MPRTITKRGKQYQQKTAKADFNPESYARKLEINRAYRARKKAKDPVKYAEEIRQKQRAYWQNMPEDERRRRVKWKSAWRRNKVRSTLVSAAIIPTGSVLATAAPSEWRDIMAYIVGKVGRCDEREDIVSEACLLTVEGMQIDEAIAAAKKSVNYEVNNMRRDTFSMGMNDVSNFIDAAF